MDEDDHAMLELIDSPHYTCRTSINHLALHGRIPNVRDETGWRSLDRRFKTIVGGSRLRKLQIGHQEIAPRFLTLLCTHFATSITELNLRNTENFESREDLVGFLAAFVVLESLRINWLELMVEPLGQPIGSARCSSRLRRLDIRPSWRQPQTSLWFFTWLSAHEVLPSIQTMILRAMGLVILRTEFFRDFMTKLGHSLRVLEIECSQGTERQFSVTLSIMSADCYECSHRLRVPSIPESHVVKWSAGDASSA